MTEEILKRGAELDRYEIREFLGRGGMGHVYRAWDPSLRRDVAIKVLNALETDLLMRFSREAEAISQLNHPNVVNIHDFRADKGHPFIVMEYLRGEDLSARLRRGSMSVGEAVDMILGVCSGVHACHRLGIIHRDLKPGNVFLNETADYDVVVKVLDFGIAMLAKSASTVDITQPGLVLGTPRYISPEQVRHIEADAKSDQYAIGLLLYVALAGKPPFGKKEGDELFTAILKAEYPRLREILADIPEGLERAITKAMSVDRDQRYASVFDLGRDVLEFATSDGYASWIDEPSSPALKGPTKRQAPKPEGRPMFAAEAIAQVSTMSGEVSQSIRGPVVVPLAPLDMGPVVETTARLQTATAIDLSQGKPPRGGLIAKTVDLHLWSEEQSVSTDGGPGNEPQPRAYAMPEGKPDVGQPPPGFLRRKRVLVVALVLIALLGAGIAWLATRHG